MTSTTAVAPPAAQPAQSLTGTRHDRSPKERAFRAALLASLAFGVAFLAVLVVYVVVDGWDRLGLGLLTEQLSARPARAGAEAAVWGSVWLVGFTALFCIPVGVLAAIYLEEYADPTRRVNRVIELNIQNLAAVPSVVYGILGLAIFVRAVGLGVSVVTGALTLSLLVLPVVIIASREAIRAVPDSIRQGSLALGATRWQTIQRQTLPAAIPGIATGSILALSRAIGEAAPLIILGVPAFIAFNPGGALDRFTAMPIVIFNWAAQPQEEFQTLASALIVVLLVVLLVMNSTAIFIRNRFQQRW